MVWTIFKTFVSETKRNELYSFMGLIEDGLNAHADILPTAFDYEGAVKLLTQYIDSFDKNTVYALSALKEAISG